MRHLSQTNEELSKKKTLTLHNHVAKRGMKNVEDDSTGYDLDAASHICFKFYESCN